MSPPRLWGFPAAAWVGAVLLCLVPAAKPEGAKLIVERILQPNAAAQAQLGPLVDSVAVTPNGVAVVGDGKNLWAVGASEIQQIAKIHGLTSFAFSPEGLLVGVRARDLVYFDPKTGDVKTIFSLPGDGMRIVPGRRDHFYIFGAEAKERYGLYELLPGRKVVKIVSSPVPITSVARVEDRTLLVAGGALYAVSGTQLRLIAGEPNGGLTSVGVDEAGERIYLSDSARIFEIQRSGTAALFGDLGGTLYWCDGGLLVFNPGKRLLVRLVGLP